MQWQLALESSNANCKPTTRYAISPLTRIHKILALDASRALLVVLGSEIVIGQDLTTAREG